MTTNIYIYYARYGKVQLLIIKSGSGFVSFLDLKTLRMIAYVCKQTHWIPAVAWLRLVGECSSRRASPRFNMNAYSPSRNALDNGNGFFISEHPRKTSRQFKGK